MTLAAVVGTGIGLDLLGGAQSAQAAEDSAAFNAAQAEEDIKLLKINEGQAMRDTRFQGASDLGSIQSAQVASGVKVSSGSALDAIRFQAEQNARNEFNIQLGSKVAQQNRRTGAALGLIEAKNRGQAFILGAAGSALTTGATFAAAR